MTLKRLKHKKPVELFFAFLFILVLWALLSVVINKPVLPAPWTALETFFKIFSSQIMPHLLQSIFRILTSLIIALLLGTACGLLFGRWDALDNCTSPLIYLTYPIPKIALLPVLIGILGIGEASKIFLISLIIFFQILVTTRDAVRNINQEIISSVLSLGAGEWDLFKHVLIPACLPKIFTSLRISLGTAMAVLFLTETFATVRGIGFFILDASMRGRYREVFAGIIAMSLMGLVLFMALDYLEKKACPWQHVQ